MSNEGVLLRVQLLRWLTVPLLLLFIADTTASYWLAQSFADRAYDRSLVEMARDVSLHLRSVGREVELDIPASALAILFNDPSDRIFFDVAALDGRRIAGRPLPEHASAGHAATEVFYHGTIDSLPVRVVRLRVRADPVMSRPAVVVRVAETTNRRTALAREMLLSMIVPQLLLIAIALAVVRVGVGRGLRPLEVIRTAVVSRATRDLSRVPLRGVPGEVRPLLVAINELLDRLSRMLTLQRRFIADAAHQLKTPVAALLAQIEVAMRETDPARAQEQLKRLNDGLVRLARLMSQLLSLARNEPEGSATTVFRDVDLAELALDAASAWVPEALKRRIDLGFEDAATRVSVRGDAIRLRELLDNLLDNAVRYSNEGGRITVRVESGLQPVVHIADDGPVISAEDRARVFERFHRLLGSPGDGSGLGLAIAQEIATLHGARITLGEDSDGTGNVFSVIFPGCQSKCPV